MGKQGDTRIADFLQKVREKYNISQAVFSGSRAKGEHLEDSDYDIILVSDDFRDIFFNKRSVFMYDYWNHWPIEIDPLCYTPEEFEAKKNKSALSARQLRREYYYKQKTGNSPEQNSFMSDFS